MSRPPYPLEALRKWRDERVEAMAQSLAAQLERCRAAEGTLQTRARARREQESQTAQTLSAEQERFAQGGASGADLLRLAEFEVAARVQGQALAQAEAGARQALVDERAREQTLREQLAKLEAEAKLVRGHEASFHEQHALRQEKADEEAALEQWSARRH